MEALIGMQKIRNGRVSKPKKAFDIHQTLFLLRGRGLGMRLGKTIVESVRLSDVRAPAAGAWYLDGI